jgi:hypothetical protein
MKMGKHKDSTKIWKHTKISKDIKMKISLSFDYLEIHKDILNITTSKMFFLKIPNWIWPLINLYFGIVFLYDLQL